MNQFYYMHFDTTVSQREAKQCMQFLSEERQRRVQKRKSEKSSLFCMLTGLFLRYGLEQTGHGNLYGHISYSDSGKPYIQGNPVYFNLSHSGDYVILFVSDTECGVDIQKKVGDKEKLAARIMNSDELKQFQDIKISTFRNTMLTDCWCAKEAYLKYTGEGIRYAMSALNVSDFLSEAQVYNVETVIGKQSCKLTYLPVNLLQFQLLDEYVCTICMEKQFCLNFCKSITKETIFSHFNIK